MGNLKFAKQVSPATAGSKMLFENLIKLETRYVQRLSKGKRPASHILKVSAVILFPVSKDAGGLRQFQRQTWR